MVLVSCLCSIIIWYVYLWIFWLLKHYVSSSDAKLLEESTESIARTFALNNCHTGNLRALIHNFLIRASELKASAQCEEWVNLLVLARHCNYLLDKIWKYKSELLDWILAVFYCFLSHSIVDLESWLKIYHFCFQILTTFNYKILFDAFKHY